MKLSTNQLKALSDERRCVKVKGFKLPISFITELEQLSAQYNIPQNQLIMQAVELFKQSKGA
ncbi:ribbon-helix-helix protein, CopG family [Mannheimia sp. E30BD]|uniref:ribbon-helix-helix protein, CopG family n=1 Tax=Mannheimia sp. E30BD TaxID=3278708 RepID=UPI00359D21AD